MHRLIQKYPFLVIMAVSSILLSACGRMDVAPREVGGDMMSEQEAIETLQMLPSDEAKSIRRGQAPVSAAQLMQLIQDLASQNRSAVDGNVDLTQLNNILTLLGSGQANSLLGLANGLVNMNGGSTAGTSSGLSKVLTLLQTLAPIIATVAPQFAPIITALTTIIPLVMTFIGLFKKKSAAVVMPWAMVRA